MTTVLFVDDNVAICTMYGIILEKSGYSFMSANSGPEALKLLESTQFDLILLDIMMEPMDGWEVLAHIRKRDDCADVSVIVLTAKSLLPRDVMEYGDAIQGFIMKPIFAETLQEYLDLIVSERDEREKSLASCGDDVTTRQQISEYMRLRQQIRVWDTMFSTIEKTFGGMADDENSDYHVEIQTIRDTIANKEGRLAELAASVKAFTT